MLAGLSRYVASRNARHRFALTVDPLGSPLRRLRIQPGLHRPRSPRVALQRAAVSAAPFEIQASRPGGRPRKRSRTRYADLPRAGSGPVAVTLSDRTDA